MSRIFPKFSRNSLKYIKLYPIKSKCLKFNKEEAIENKRLELKLIFLFS